MFITVTFDHDLSTGWTKLAQGLKGSVKSLMAQESVKVKVGPKQVTIHAMDFGTAKVWTVLAKDMVINLTFP